MAADAQVIIELKAQTDNFKREVSSALTHAQSSVTKFGASVSKALSATTLLLAGSSIKAASEFESAFAGVKKTVDGTEQEFAQLRKAIIETSKEIPVTPENIAHIAELGGQLGVAKDRLLDFSQVVAKLDVATNLNIDEAAQGLAQFANITDMSIADAERFGSTLVDLGNNAATSEKDILAMAMRLAAAGTQAGLSSRNILGISTAMASLGIEAEAGGSAVSKLLTRINKDVATNSGKINEWAKLAGLSVDEFKTKFKNDAAGAFTDVIRGMGQMQESGGNLAILLDELGIKDIRMIDAVGRLAQGYSGLDTNIQRANKAWDENNALAKEAAQRFETFESQLQLFKNRLRAIQISLGTPFLKVLNRLLNAATPLLDKVQALAEKFEHADDSTVNLVAALTALAAAAAPLYKVFSKIGSYIGGQFTKAFKDLKVGATQSVEGLKLIGKGLDDIFKARGKGNVTLLQQIRKSLNPQRFAELGQEIKAAWTKTLGDIGLKTDGILSKMGSIVEHSLTHTGKMISKAVNFAPGLTKQLGATVQFANKFREIISTNFQNVAKQAHHINRVFKRIGDPLKTIGVGTAKAFSGMTNSIKGAGRALGALALSTGLVFSGLAAISQSANMSRADIDKLTASFAGKFEAVLSNLPNAINSLAAQIPNMFNALGQSLPGIVSALAQAFSSLGQSLPEVLKNVASAIPGIVQGIVSMIQTGAPMLLQAGIALFQGLIQAIPQVLPQLVQAIPPLVQAIAQGIPTFVGLILQAGVQLLSALVQAIPQVLPTIVAAIPTLITGLVEALIVGLPQLIAGGVQLLLGLVQAIPQVIPTLIAAIPQLVIGIATALIGAIPTLLSGAVQLFLGIILAIPQALPAIIGAIPQIILGIVAALISAIPQIIQGAFELLKGILLAVPQILIAIPEACMEIIFALADGLIAGVSMIIDAGVKLFDSLMSIFTGKKPDAKSAGAGLSESASAGVAQNTTNFNQEGIAQAQGYSEGLSTGAGAAQAGAQEISQGALNALGQAAPQANAAGAEFTQSFAEGQQSNAGVVTGAATDIGNQAAGALDATAAQSYNAGSNVGKSAADGISSQSGAINASAQGLGSGAANSLNGQAGAFSTSGKNLGQAATKGVSSTQGQFTNAAQTVGQQGNKALDGQKNTYQLTGQGLGNSTAQGIKSKGSDVQNACREVGKKGTGALKESEQTAKSIGGNISDGLAAGIRNRASAVINAARNAARAAFAAAKNFLGIHSPSRKFAYLGRMTGAGTEQGIKQSTKGVIGTLKTQVRAMEKTVAGADLMATVKANMSGLIPSPLPSNNLGAAYAYAAQNVTNNTYSIAGITIEANSAQDETTIKNFIDLVRRHDKMGAM